MRFFTAAQEVNRQYSHAVNDWFAKNPKPIYAEDIVKWRKELSEFKKFIETSYWDVTCSSGPLIFEHDIPETVK